MKETFYQANYFIVSISVLASQFLLFVSFYSASFFFAGDLDVVLDPFITEFEQTTVNRKQSAMIINHVLMGVIKDGERALFIYLYLCNVIVYFRRNTLIK